MAWHRPGPGLVGPTTHPCGGPTTCGRNDNFFGRGPSLGNGGGPVGKKKTPLKFRVCPGNLGLGLGWGVWTLTTPRNGFRGPRAP